MRDIKQEVEQFLKILYRQYPELIGRVEYNLTISSYPAKVFDLDLNFPSDYRDQVLTIAKFCGIYFVHEYHTFSENIGIFQTDPQFF